MGQPHSSEAAQAATPEQLSSRLAHRLAEKCFTPLELTHFKDIFTSLADNQSGISYWKEETLCKFLQIPDAFGVNHVLGQMAGYLGAWPFSSLAPAIMTRESLIKIVALLSKRYRKVLRGGSKDRAKILFRSLAVYDRRMSQARHPELKATVEEELSQAQIESPTRSAGFFIDKAAADEEEDDEDDDEMALAALEALDAIEVFSLGNSIQRTEVDKISFTQIPLDNFRSLTQLLIVIAPLQEQGSLIEIAKAADETRIGRVQYVANCIVWAFTPDQLPGITYANYRRIMSNALPWMYEGLNSLFEHFLFSKHLDLSKKRRTSSSGTSAPSDQTTHAAQQQRQAEVEPILFQTGDILDDVLLCQLSFFIPSSMLFRRLRLLYKGSSDGFSINSFEQRVLNWRAPTIFLVQGSRTEADSSSTSHDSFPDRRFGSGSTGGTKSGRVTFGALMNSTWKHTYKEAFGDSSALLFQLEPVHSVFRASTLNHEYATLTKSGISFGSPVPHDKPVSGLPGSNRLPLGAVSLNVDSNLENGVFMHDSAGGGAFNTVRSRIGADGKSDWEERFDVEHIEVWGCGGDEIAKEQMERWKWEEREAQARRGLAKSEDKEQTYALLEMAGLVGQNRSGGSMG